MTVSVVCVHAVGDKNYRAEDLCILAHDLQVTQMTHMTQMTLLTLDSRRFQL